MINYYSKHFKNPTSPAGFVNETFSYCRINIYFCLISALVIVYLAIFIELVNFYLAFQFQFVKSVLDDCNS